MLIIIQFVAKWFPLFFQFSAWAFFAFLVYKNKNQVTKDYRLAIKYLILLLGIEILFSIFLTASQYYAWSQSELTKIFLSQPLKGGLPFSTLFNNLGNIFGNNSGYFLFYSFGRFWLSLILTISVVLVIAFVFWLTTRLRGVVGLGVSLYWFLCGIVISGWPLLIIYLPLTLIISIITGLVYKKRNPAGEIDLGVPSLVALALVLLFGRILAKYIGLGVLTV
jgi:hypothetical protein